MPELNIRSDSVDVEEIMRRVRARIAEKHGVSYSEQDVQQLAAAKLQTFFDPQKVRADLLEEIRRVHMDPNTELGEETLFGSSKPWLRFIRRLLRPITKLFVNTTPLVHAAMVRNGDIFAELVHNLVVETTRLNLEIKALKMRVESLSSRLDFDERRAKALEGVVQYRPAPAEDSARPRGGDEEDEAGGDQAPNRPRRRRRRRGRRGTGQQGAGEAGGEAMNAAPGDQPSQAPAEQERRPEPRTEAPSTGEAPDR
jgi:hypothetical protein